jgi:hypothetical protein
MDNGRSDEESDRGVVVINIFGDDDEEEVKTTKSEPLSVPVRPDLLPQVEIAIVPTQKENNEPRRQRKQKVYYN